MQRSRRSISPKRGLSINPISSQHSPVKGGTYDSELMRVLRERDEMQGALEKYERHLSEIQANVKVLTADRDKTSMYHQQAQQEIAALRREVMQSRSMRSSSKGGVTPQRILKRVEAERDEAQADLQRMTTERDSLRERLKINQETAISERAHLEQRVEDLQTACLTLEQERGEQRNRQVMLKEAMRELEDEVQGLSQKLSGVEEELNGFRNECSILRLAHNESESNLNETQRRLTSRIGDLQKIQERNKLLDEKNDSLLRQLAGMREDMSSLQDSESDLQQQKVSLQELLEKRSLQLSMTNSQLDENEQAIRSLKINTEELETTIRMLSSPWRGLRESVNVRDCELGLFRKKLSDSEDELGATLKHRDATSRENSQLRDELDKARIDNQALHLKVDDCSQEMENLQRRVQEYADDITRIEDLLASKEHECRELQESRRRASLQAESWEGQARQAETVAGQLRMELVTVDLECQGLKEKMRSLEASLQEAVSAERGSCGQLSQLNRRLLQLEEELRETQKQQSIKNTDLEKTRELCVKLDINKEALQRELEASHSEVTSLRKQLFSERASTNTLETMLVSTRNKDLHRQLGSQERAAEVHLLRDKLTAADTKASSQSREVCHLRTRSSLLESDLEVTKKKLATERFDRERAVLELRRQGLSSTLSSTLSSSLRPSSPPLRRSISPQRSWSPERPFHSTPERRSPKRSTVLRDLYD
ncbi:testis-specific gene 10 protein isoform X1 [Clupea harengus]|uniref:Testis-specific gene 10 protein isoform X1 n=1 Tax=Clupea harengus TaxID=7950 RepID=A0A6P8ETV1_CLUHA|nr:testis-specific gene 10 protein isoform X1 [Clupea harengus]XP_031414285.1 testis-specific gene 10 protein isoform X1 [Clupea harengus]XP_031414287.1 testis-specific gene 10 protein isoform X1 [Clupea harengus]